jgi:hypothetical protein
MGKIEHERRAPDNLEPDESQKVRSCTNELIQISLSFNDPKA